MYMLPFNFHHLYYFYRVAQLGSVSKAAEEVRVSQPALSFQIKQFEAYLGEKLFEREGRNLRLTEEGRTAYAYAQDIFDAGREWIDHVRDRTQKGRLRLQIGITDSVPKAFAVALLRFIYEKNPSVQVQLNEEHLRDMVENLKNHTLDLILSNVPCQGQSGEKILQRLIGRIPIVFYVTKKNASKYKRFPTDLDNAPVLLPTSHSGVYHAVLEYFSAHHINPNIIAEIQDVELIQQMALEGAGIAPLNQFSVLTGPWKKKLVPLRIARDHDIHDTAYLLIRKRKKNHPLVDQILEDFRIAV